jgi:hypothetical protein
MAATFRFDYKEMVDWFEDEKYNEHLFSRD